MYDILYFRSTKQCSRILNLTRTKFPYSFITDISNSQFQSCPSHFRIELPDFDLSKWKKFLEEEQLQEHSALLLKEDSRNKT